MFSITDSPCGLVFLTAKTTDVIPTQILMTYYTLPSEIGEISEISDQHFTNPGIITQVFHY